jgi:dihydroflavonol-4-reductase
MVESTNPRSALVTGATGFVGSNLVDGLVERGYKVRCLVRGTSNSRYLKHSGLEFVEGGLNGSTDWDRALEGVDTIYHVAGLTFARRARDYFEVNQKGTEAILAAAVKHRGNLKKFVYVSSQAAVGPSRDGTPVSEGVEPRPISPYGESKLLGEEAVRAVRDLIDFCIVRPPAVYGPRDYAILEIFKSVARGFAPAIGPHDMQFSLVHVRDLVEGIILAGESKVSIGRTYFISSDKIYSMRAVNELLGQIIGRRPRNISIPRPVAFAVAIAAEMAAAVTRKPPVINRDKVRDFSQSCWGCSIEAARHDLAYEPKVALETGMRETFEWYKREGWI